jgi:hypothetical protein
MTEHIAATADDLATRYVALWNEPDAGRRRSEVRALWAEEGSHLLLPPQEYRQAADRLGFPGATLEAKGHAALDVRVGRAYQEFVAPGGYTFALRGRPQRLGDVVRLSWDMLDRAAGTPAGGGTEFLVLDAAGRILADHQFIDD